MIITYIWLMFEMNDFGQRAFFFVFQPRSNRRTANLYSGDQMLLEI